MSLQANDADAASKPVRSAAAGHGRGLPGRASGAAADRPSWTRHAYVRGNPPTRVDPTGAEDGDSTDHTPRRHKMISPDGLPEGREQSAGEAMKGTRSCAAMMAKILGIDPPLVGTAGVHKALYARTPGSYKNEAHPQGSSSLEALVKATELTPPIALIERPNLLNMTRDQRRVTAVRSHVLAYLQGGVCGLGPGDVMPVPGTIGIKNAWVQRESV
ncbi:MAG: hypothetical protein ABFD84_16885, partial [Candidatus Polarisedimenticolia bacterium]